MWSKILAMSKQDIERNLKEFEKERNDANKHKKS